MVRTNRLIFDKLESFISRFYMNELIRGSLLFVGLGLLYLLFTLFIEYFLWLQPSARTFLFWSFVLVEFFLLFRFILFPLFQLVHIKKGINYFDASKIIGNHFPDVQDKLLNLLQLSQNAEGSSDLVLASIDQKSKSLSLVPFGNAINFKANIKFLPVALIPLFFILLFFVSGNSSVISQSLNRVLHYKTTFIKPAPFELVILNDFLSTLEQQKFVLKVQAKGKAIPQNVSIFIGEERYFMEQTSVGNFQYSFNSVTDPISFHLEANSVISQDYILDVIKVPAITQLTMQLNFPSYLKRKSEQITGSGNALVPEGTRISWNITGNSLEGVNYVTSKSNIPFQRSSNSFNYTTLFTENTDYQLFTSNSKLKNYEKLPFSITVVKDQFPSIEIQTVPDSIAQGKKLLLGKIADDYGFSKLHVVYYPLGKPNNAQRGTIVVSNGVYDQFVFDFPSNLNVEPGVTYQYYFEIFDNDAIHNFKGTKSTFFSNKISTPDEIENSRLQEQQNSINSLSKTLSQQQKQFADLDKFNALTKKKKEFEFKEQEQIKDFLEKQKQQDRLMQSFSEKIKENLTKEISLTNDQKRETLEKRLDNVSSEIEKNKKLLDELNELTKKLDPDNFNEKLQQFKQISKNQAKTLEQLVELTKRYYIEKKTSQLADKFEKLAKEQKQLSEQNNNDSDAKQQQLEKDFNDLQKELSDVKKENQSLKSPFDFPKTEGLEKSIQDEINQAQKELSKNNNSSAQKAQNKAADDLKKLSNDLDQSMEQSEQDQLQEDVTMLRQTLDNLLSFSLTQEDVMKQFRTTKVGSSVYNFALKKQQSLKQQFKHIDDSLFALSLRNEKITDNVTKEIGNVLYNLDNAIDKLGNGVQQRGVSYQQFVIAATNKLADFLSDLLNNMQMSLSGSSGGQPKPGQGQGMQLPDIISKQKGLGDKLSKLQKGNQSQPNGSGSKPGSSSEGNNGEGDALRLLEIYKEQQSLREALQNALQKNAPKGIGQNTIEQMKQVEKQLLTKGFKNDVLQRVQQITQELLKLDNALREQGQDLNRKSEANAKLFTNPIKALSPSVIQYMNSVEILNRQSLPLRSDFNQRVQTYFKKND